MRRAVRDDSRPRMRRGPAALSYRCMRTRFGTLVLLTVGCGASAPLAGVAPSAPPPASRVAVPPPASAPANAPEARHGWAKRAFGEGRLHASASGLVRAAKKLEVLEAEGTVVASRDLPSGMRATYVDGDATSELLLLHPWEGAKSVEALDTRTLATRWLADVDFPKGSVLRATGNQDVLVVQADSPTTKPAAVVLVLDAKSGKKLWGRTSHDLSYDPAWVAGDAVYLQQSSNLEAFDARRGASRWKRKVGAIELSGHEDKLLVHDGKSFVALDAKSGTPIGSVTTGLRSSVALAAGVLYAKVKTGELEHTRAVRERVVAIEVATAKLLWESLEWTQLDASFGTGPLTLARDEVLFCTSDGVVRGLDRASGALRWEQGFGTCDSLLAKDTRAGIWLYVGPKPDVYTTADVPLESVFAQGTVTLGGKPISGARVAAFGAETTSGADGRYTLQARGRGKLVVQALADVGDTDPKCARYAAGASTATSLAGTVDVALAQVCSCGVP